MLESGQAHRLDELQVLLHISGPHDTDDLWLGVIATIVAAPMRVVYLRRYAAGDQPLAIFNHCMSLVGTSHHFGLLAPTRFQRLIGLGVPFQLGHCGGRDQKTTFGDKVYLQRFHRLFLLRFPSEVWEHFVEAHSRVAFCNLSACVHHLGALAPVTVDGLQSAQVLEATRCSAVHAVAEDAVVLLEVAERALGVFCCVSDARQEVSSMPVYEKVQEAIDFAVSGRNAICCHAQRIGGGIQSTQKSLVRPQTAERVEDQRLECAMRQRPERVRCGAGPMLPENVHQVVVDRNYVLALWKVAHYKVALVQNTANTHDYEHALPICAREGVAVPPLFVGVRNKKLNPRLRNAMAAKKRERLVQYERLLAVL
mmetsp:Transcript_58528/g.163214  ORF Transcript_58528/g.163214 Transcript_58528/m.163214 type:complete len:368 (-) Transcript_58528:247-1350(-)